MAENTSKQIISNNRKASFQYFLIEKFESGIQLYGSEVKSIRESKVNIKEAYVKFKKNELYLTGMHIGEYSHSGYSTHEPVRDRKLLLHKIEINKIIKNVSVKGTTVIPISLYFKNGLVKVEIAIAKGKKTWDKREAKKEKDIAKRLKNF